MPHTEESVGMQILSPDINQPSSVNKINSVVPNLKETPT